jgi:hypothetical protein
VVLTKTHTAIATLYYLLLDNILAKRKTAGLNGLPNPNYHHSNISSSSGLTRTYSANGNRVGVKSSGNVISPPYYSGSGNGAISKGPTVGNIPTYHGGGNIPVIQNQVYTFVQPQTQNIAIQGNGNNITKGVVAEPAAGLSSQVRPRSASASRSSAQKPLIAFIGNR